MFITLTSKGQTNHARFSNHFLDNLVIPPNSEVALVNGCVAFRDEDDVMTIPAGTNIILRANNFNFLTVSFPTQQIYTKQQLVDEINRQLKDNQPYGIRFQAELEQSDEQMALVVFVPSDYDDDEDFMNYVYGSNKRDFGIQTVTGQPPLEPILTTNGTFVRQFPIKFGSLESTGGATQFPHAPPAGKTFSINTANASHAFNRARVALHTTADNTVYDSWTVVKALNGSNHPVYTELPGNIMRIAYGFGAYNRAVSEYINVPGITPPSDAITFHGSSNTTFTPQGSYFGNYNVLNSETGGYDLVNFRWNCGDMFRKWLTIDNSAPTAPAGNRLYNSAIRRYPMYGLVYHLPGNLSHYAVATPGTYKFNQFNIEHEDSTGFFDTCIDNQNILNQSFYNEMGYEDGNLSPADKVLGCYSGYGQKALTDYNIDTILPKPSAVAVQDMSFNETFRTAGAKLHCAVLNLERRLPASGAGAVQDAKQHIDLSNYEIVSGESSAVSFLFTLKDDSAYNTDASRTLYCLMGGRNSGLVYTNLIQLDTTGLLAYDISIAPYINGQPHQQLALTDGTGSRPNIAFDTIYSLYVGFTGGDGILKITLTEYNADMSNIVGTSYTSTTTIGAVATTFGKFGNFSSLGGIANMFSPDASNYFAGTFSNFRIYCYPENMNTNQYVINETTTSANPASEMIEFFLGNYDSPFRTGQPANGRTTDDSSELLSLGMDAKYAVCGDYDMPGAGAPDRNNYMPSFQALHQQGGSVVDQDPNYPDIVDFFSVPDLMMSTDVSKNNYEGTSNLPLTCYTGNGSGVVNTDTLVNIVDFPNADAQDHRELAPYAWFNPGEARPYGTFLMDAETGRTAGEDNFRLCIDNLPIRSFNGKTNNLSKCIYEFFNDNVQSKGKAKVLPVNIPERLFIPLNNPGQLILNQLDVVITDADDKEQTELESFTTANIVIRSQK